MRINCPLAATLVLFCGACIGNTSADVTPYEDAYLYAAYYPDTITYAAQSWADDWATSPVILAAANATPVVSDAGATAASETKAGLAGAIQTLARGGTVCPGQVSIAIKTAAPACNGAAAPAVRNGVTLTFSACQLGTETVDGVVNLTSSRSASDATCTPTTMIMLRNTLTLTGVVIRGAVGGRILIPSQSVTTTATYIYGQTPTTVQAIQSGEIQTFDSSDVLKADITFDGSGAFSVGDGSAFVVDGTATYQDTAGAMATVTKTDLTRTRGCCRPTDGTVVVDRIGGPRAARTTWTFGPDCGIAGRDRMRTTLPTCVDCELRLRPIVGRRAACADRAFVENSSLSSIPKLANAAIAGPEPARSESSMRILVVEDDPNVRDMLSLLLGTRWNVSIAADAAGALDLVRRTTPDLVISDVRMPRVDGITLLRRLRDEPATRDVPVILVSGQAGEQETIAGLEAGADDFLVKPFSARELLVRVQTRLEVTAMRRRNAQQEAALESMRRHTAWTERLLDSLPVPLLLLQPGEARILFANRATVALFGTRLARGAPLSDFASLRLPDEEGAAEIPADQLAPLSSRTRLQGRRLVWDTPGGKVWLLADCELVPGLHDHPDDVAVLTLRDITRVVTHEQELRRTVHLREEFLSTASHELRTPDHDAGPADGGPAPESGRADGRHASPQVDRHSEPGASPRPTGERAPGRVAADGGAPDPVGRRR